MAMSIAQARTLSAKYAAQSAALGVAVLAIVVSLVVGGAARRQRSVVNTRLTALRTASSEVSSFRSAFRPSASDPTVLRLPDSLATSVDRSARVSLAQQIASSAETLGLNAVRVRFVPVDSTSPPPTPQTESTTPVVADYALSVECSGTLGNVLSLVNHLPPSVALQRLVAGSKNGIAVYVITLAVIETAKAPQHG
jgi:hypothetical protein